MRVFISHANVDQELAADLTDLLQLGIGISYHDIFCSSISGSIPNGVFFVQHILSNLQSADLVVAVLSRSYFRSNFCVAEAGVAQVRQMAGTATFYSLLVPPVDFPDLDGVLYGVQSGRIVDRKALDGLHDRAIKGMVKPPPTSMWNDKRDVFLRAVASKVYRQIATELITVQDVYPERSSDPAVTYKSKLRVVFRNDTGERLDVKIPAWVTTSGDVPIQQPPASSLQVEGPKGWERGNWQPESPAIGVPAGRAFRAWIGLDETFSDQDLRRRHETRRLGMLILPIKIHGHDVTIELRL